ncbi:adenylate kinase family enzyme [Natronobacillus azotifigens]|uniref:Uncharacterized protein n=1 Tax=Natronobacillus azotifigens TaxID=472978 RepID=A0A9J6RBE3_9BACI|nr:hypothetical protein [Natronobacillus azotifigens]MCZ0703000.1 hypothetical protein [Natronobacillus azotifigens]
MIIEFIAPPGSGKTYLAKKIESLFKQEDTGIDGVYTRADISKKGIQSNSSFTKRIFNKLSYLSFIDGNFIRICLKILKSKKKIKIKKREISYILVNFKNNMIINRNINNKSIVILDEGIIQASGIYMGSKYNPKLFDHYLNSVMQNKKINYSKHSKIYIIIESNIEKNYERIEKRKQGWPKVWSEYTNIQKHSALENEFEKVKEIQDRLLLNGENVFLIKNDFNRDSFISDFSQIIKLVNYKIKENNLEFN